MSTEDIYTTAATLFMAIAIVFVGIVMCLCFMRNKAGAYARRLHLAQMVVTYVENKDISKLNPKLQHIYNIFKQRQEQSIPIAQAV